MVFYRSLPLLRSLEMDLEMHHTAAASALQGSECTGTSTLKTGYVKRLALQSIFKSKVLCRIVVSRIDTSGE